VESGVKASSGRKIETKKTTPKVDERLAIGWYVLRVTYSRELKLQDRLNALNIKTYVPMKRVRIERNGKVIRELRPAVNNLLFALANRVTLEGYMQSEGDAHMTSFFWDKATRKPIVVPQKQMEDFMKVSEVAKDEAVYLTEISEKLRNGTKVMVKAGPFAGVEGTIVRIKKSRRILVEIPGVMSVASTYVPIEDLEVLEQ